MFDFLISPAYAQSAGGGAFSTSGLLQFAPYLLVFAIMYFVLIRPQQQKQKQLREGLGKLRRGDRVLTAGGIVGVVRKAEEGADEIEVEIAQNVVVRVARQTISSVLSSASKPANDTGATGKAAS
ncbi:protein translocase subunit YajC [Acetobacter nitrogenifigens DSM 23921 = NBRC 105050]|uniref:Sec translocon accessory complex subunit YajC n=1 Tax=Acetobacter nitrogenifigens DSM 23921 = NBRC 105050 TaxID=1120919 RepID=A0A511X6J6_9PROT|nr:preprotein translocase subunit YajC [Acetobacter nitrogenifigens]GBQ94541.1 protein translocase subunit YajC [Acetobacter nitrogenifigens DSM 23921 = NBRC 105050]GEN58551.1 preprotein translocase subunit YajC [Acetobacter nitrogenifigens DSM 23921 = NBRC 105050]